MTENILDHLKVQVERLPDLDDGDILIVKGPDHMTEREQHDLMAAIRYVLRGQSRANTVLVIPGSFQSARATDAELAAMGLQRLQRRSAGVTTEDLRRLGVEPLTSDVFVESGV